MSFPEDPNAPKRYKGLEVFDCGHIACPHCEAHNGVNAQYCQVCNCPIHSEAAHMEPTEAFDAIKRGGKTSSWRERKQREQQREREAKLHAVMNQTQKAEWEKEASRTDTEFMAEVDNGLADLLRFAHYEEI